MSALPSGPPPSPLLRRLLRWLAVPLEWLLALVILFEEWGWEPLQRLMAQLARYPVVAALELRVVALPPGSALLVFALPVLLLLPVNLLGLWLTGHGQAALGSSVLVAAKLVSTTLVARIFTLTRPALMTLSWFADLYRRWVAFEARLLAPVRASWIWRAGRAASARVREWWRLWKAAWRRRWSRGAAGSGPPP